MVFRFCIAHLCTLTFQVDWTVDTSDVNWNWTVDTSDEHLTLFCRVTEILDYFRLQLLL